MNLLWLYNIRASRGSGSIGRGRRRRRSIGSGEFLQFLEEAGDFAQSRHQTYNEALSGVISNSVLAGGSRGGGGGWRFFLEDNREDEEEQEGDDRDTEKEVQSVLLRILALWIYGSFLGFSSALLCPTYLQMIQITHSMMAALQVATLVTLHSWGT